jgi:succinate-semialdehyde dehydrogenase / glutarate-semialdehyde dehydrogenase
VATGRKVGVRCAQRLIPAFLELGGKDPAVVLSSADIDSAASAILRASVSATGQACQSLERVYVDQAIAQPFIARLVNLARQCQLNFPDIASGQIGPIIFARQAEIIQNQLNDALAQGALIHCGGVVENLGGGLWLRPTVLSQVTHAMRLMQEENFGPVIPIMTFASAEEAIALANFGEFGLSAAVFAGTVDEALLVARRLEAGAVSINDGALTSLIYDAEKNAFKHSGIGGSRMGAAGLARFFRKRALLIQEGNAATMAMFEEAQLPL